MIDYIEWINVIDELPSNDDAVLIETECGEIFTAICWIGDFIGDGSDRSLVSYFRFQEIENHPDKNYKVKRWAVL